METINQEKIDSEELLKFVCENDHKIELGYCIGDIFVKRGNYHERVLMYDGFPCPAVVREIQEQITKEWNEQLDRASLEKLDKVYGECRWSNLGVLDALGRENCDQLLGETREMLSREKLDEIVEKLRERVYELNDEYWENYPFGKEAPLLAAKELIDEYDELCS